MLRKGRRVLGVFFPALFALFFSSSVFSAPPSFSGTLDNRYTFRTTGDVRDQDLESIVSLSVGNPSLDRFSAFLQGGGLFDLDGPGSGSTYSSISDTFAQRASGRLYSAYADVRKTKPMELIRVGRQNRYEFENLYFDGLSFDSLPFYGFSVSGFGGVPVHLYETEIGFDPGDWLVGGNVKWTPINPLRLSLDYSHIRDDNQGPRASQGIFEDDIFGFSLFADITKTIDFYAHFSSFSDEVRDVEGASSFRFPKHDFTLRVNGYRLLRGYDIRVTDGDAYRFIGTYQPYTEFGFTATKGIGKKFVLDTGFSMRLLDDQQVASTYNHGFERAFLSASSTNFLAKGLSLVATGDYYHGEDNTLKDNTFGGSFYASYGSKQIFNNRLKLKGGTAFYLYRYNVLAGNESDNVQTYFASIEGKLTKQLTLKTSYEFEDNEINNFHTAKTVMSWSF